MRNHSSPVWHAGDTFVDDCLDPFGHFSKIPTSSWSFLVSLGTLVFREYMRESNLARSFESDQFATFEEKTVVFRMITSCGDRAVSGR